MEDRTRGECTGESGGSDGGSLDVAPDAPEVECTVALPDDLAADLDDFCRRRYLHRDEAIRTLLADWLDGRSVE